MRFARHGTEFRPKFKRTDVRIVSARGVWNGRVIDGAQVTHTALIHREAVADAFVNRRAAGKQGDGSGGPAVVLQAVWVEVRIDRRGNCSDDVLVGVGVSGRKTRRRAVVFADQIKTL